jgi:hypothetical protein
VLPDYRTSAAVKDSEHNQQFCANPEVHRIRKASRDGASNIPKHDRVSRRSGRSSRDSFFNLCDKLLAEPVALLVVPDGCILKLAFLQGVERRREASSRQARPDRSLDLVPRNYIIGERFVVRNAAIQFRALRLGERESLGVGADGCPYLLDQREPLIDIESIYAQRFNGNTHGRPLSKIAIQHVRSFPAQTSIMNFIEKTRVSSAIFTRCNTSHAGTCEQ